MDFLVLFFGLCYLSAALTTCNKFTPKYTLHKEKRMLGLNCLHAGLIDT